MADMYKFLKDRRVSDQIISKMKSDKVRYVLILYSCI